MKFPGLIKNGILALAFLSLPAGALFAQCNITINQGDSVSVPCGSAVGLSVWHSAGLALNNNFNNSSSGVGWTTTAGVLFTNPCGPHPNGTTYMWMGPGTPHPRSLTSIPLDVTCGGDVCFDLKMAIQGQPAPCEGPDLTTEGVYFEWSINGVTWNTIFYFQPAPFGAAGPYTSWANYCYTIPPAALTASTQFRWIQIQSSTNPFDHWGLDEITIQNNCGQAQVFWSNGDTLDSTTINPILNSGYFISTLVVQGDTCEDSIYVTVENPDIQAIVDQDTVCAGVEVNLQVDTSQSNYLVAGLTYNYSWFPSTLVANSTAQSTTATINFPTTLVASIIHPSFPSCSSTDTVDIHVQNNLVFDNVSLIDEHCGLAQGGIADGQVDVTVTGGTGNYFYEFNNTGYNSSNSYGGLTAGAVQINIVDSTTNCLLDTNVTLSTLNGLNLETIFENDVTCAGYCDGSVFTTISGAIGTPFFDWQGAGQSGNNLDSVFNLCAGNMVLVITDDYCTYTHAFAISEPDSLAMNLQLGESKICMRENTSLFANVIGGTPPYNYHWNNLPSSPSHSVSPDIPTAYELVVTDAHACFTDTANAWLDVFPPIITSTVDDTVCPNEDATMTISAVGGNGNYQYHWSGNISSEPSLTIAQKESSTFFITVDDGCVWPIVDTVDLNIFPLPDPNFLVENDSSCAPANLTFSFNGTRVKDVSWDFGDGQVADAISTKISNLYEQGGTFPVTLKLTSTDLCELEWDREVNLFDPPVANFTWDTTKSYDVLENTVRLVNLSEGADSYSWDFPNGDSDKENPIVTLDVPKGIYFMELLASTDEGCTDFMKKPIELRPRGGLWVPLAFSPNDDGVNDVFFPVADAIIITSYQISIFNRWGEEIYYSNDIEVPWSGDGAQDGAYMWRISYKSEFGEIIKKEGMINIMR